MIQFHHIPNWLLVLLTTCWLLGILLDFRYRVHSMRWVRLILWTLVIGATGLFYTKPHRYQEKNPVKASLLGMGEPADSLHRQGYNLVTETSELHGKRFSELLLVDTLLPTWSLEMISTEKFTMIHDKPTGLLDFQLPPTILQGEETSIRIVSSFNEQVSLSLRQAGKPMDSSAVAAGLQSTVLRIIPKSYGNFTYQILATKANDTLAQEVIPVVVQKASAPAVLMLLSNPNFEARRIKNCLSDLGYSISTRTRISQERFLEEFINTRRTSLQQLTSRLLKQFQWIILDKPAFDLLPHSDKRRLQQFNQEGKLGLLVINSDPSQMKGLWADVPSPVDGSIKIAGIQLPAQQLPGLSSIAMEQQVLGYFQHYGIGKVGLLTVQNLYQVALQGHETKYQQAIKSLASALLPFQPTSAFIRMDNVPMIRTKTRVQFTSISPEPRIFIGKVPHPVRESAFRKGLFETDFWPQKEGWNELTIFPDSIEHSFYVFGEQDWIQKRENERLAANELFMATYSDNEEPIIALEKRYIPRWTYWLVILVGLGLLWAEQRFVNP